MDTAIRTEPAAMSPRALAAVLLAALMHATPLPACEEHADVRALLDPLPPPMAGMRVELHTTLGPQIVLENRTGRTVEIMDDTGAAFVRIGPDGVEGNFAARSWYLTYSPGAVVPAAAQSGGPPRWVRAASTPSFGWFEPRLDPKRAPLPIDVIQARQSVDLARWSVPLRVDGVLTALGGVFRYQPPPKGMHVARLTSPSEIAPGVRVRLLRGSVAGVFIDSSSPIPLEVEGAEGEPFLRIGPDGVSANVHSPTWWASARATGRRHDVAESDRATLPDWQHVAAAPRFGWVDPRTQAAPGADNVAWRLPLRLGEQQLAITGETHWQTIGPMGPIGLLPHSR
jgi:hypothetical protein